MKNLSSIELYKLFEKKQKEELEQYSLSANSRMIKLKTWLLNKQYVKEICQTTSVTYYYKLDTLHSPVVINDKWVQMQQLMLIRIASQLDPKLNTLQCSIEITDSKYKVRHNNDKCFHFNDFEKLSEITESEFMLARQLFDQMSKCVSIVQ